MIEGSKRTIIGSYGYLIENESSKSESSDDYSIYKPLKVVSNY